MKRILVPTDFSEHAEYATEIAAKIAKKNGGRLFLLHIVDIPVYENWNFKDFEDAAEGLHILKSVKQNFKKLIDKPFLKDVNVVEVVQFENIYDTITEQADKNEIDLIVMGSHGTSGWKEHFVGSNTEKVVRLSNCPVLTIKKKYDEFNIKDIVFASNFYGEASTGFEKIKEFANLFDAKIHLLKVVTADRFETTSYSKQLIKDFAKKVNLKNYVTEIYNSDTVENGIREFCNETNADLIAMETHGRRGISHLLQGSITEDVVNHVQRPVLSMKIEETNVKYGVIFPGK